MIFCGLYTSDSGDKRYHIPDTEAEVRKEIPDAINDAFAISEMQGLETGMTCMKIAVTQLPQERDGISSVHRPRKIIVKANTPFDDIPQRYSQKLWNEGEKVAYLSG
jgi:hypothetical protein